MFSLASHDSIPTGIGFVSMTLGGNYVYDPLYEGSDRYIGEVLFTAQFPIPFGKEVSKNIDTPYLMRGLLKSKRYTGNGSNIKFDPISSGNSSVEIPPAPMGLDGSLPVVKDGNRPMASFKAAPGMKKFWYTTTESYTVTRSGVSVWYYRGKRYSRPWTRSYDRTKTVRRFYWAFDTSYVRKSSTRHLNDCTHSKIEGTLWLYSPSLGFQRTSVRSFTPRTVWPAVCNSGVWAPTVDGSPASELDLPAGVPLDGKTYNLLPRLYKSFSCKTNQVGNVMQDTLYPYMAGVCYVGEIYISTTSAKGVSNIYACTWRETRYGTKQYVRYYGWVYDPKAYRKYFLFRSQIFEIPSYLTHSESAAKSHLRSYWSKHVNQVVWREHDYTNTLETRSADLGSFSLTESYQELYDRLWRVTLPENMERLYTRYVSLASQTALLNTKVLNINTLAYLKDFLTLKSLCNSYTDLLKKGISPRTASGAYLASHYGVRLTIQDTKEIIRRARRELSGMLDAYQYSRGSTVHDLQGPLGDIHVKANVSVLFSLYDQQLRRFLADIARWDLLPTPRVIWDMIPLSFVVDWLVPIGSKLEAVDALVASGTIDQRRCCWSQKTEAVLDPILLTSALLREDTSVVSCSGDLKLIGYKRQYQAYAPNPLAGLDLFEIDPSWSKSRLYEITALSVQRFT